jgi:hypothetical protein
MHHDMCANVIFNIPLHLSFIFSTDHLVAGIYIVLQAGTRPKPDVMLPSVEILAIKIRFGVRDDERTLLAYLRAFPNIRTLHIQVLTLQCKIHANLLCGRFISE